MTTADVRAANLDKRNQLIRDAFFERYTKVPRERKPDRALVVEKLAHDYYLSVKTVEKLLWVPNK